MELEKRDRTSLEEISFEEIEKGFKHVMNELSADASFEKFRGEYEKLFEALKKSYEGENRLLRKCLDLNAEIVANTAKVSAALKMTEDDQAMIRRLKKDLEVASQKIEESHLRETEQMNSIETYQQEVRNLTKFIEQNSGATVEQNRIAAELAQKETELTSQKEELLKEIVALRNSLSEAELRGEEREAQIDELTGKVHDLEQDIQTKLNESQKEGRRKEKLERELKQMQADIQAKSQENQNLLQKVEQLTKDKNTLERDKVDLKQTLEKQQKDKEMLEVSFQKMQSDFEAQLATCDVLNSENQNKIIELKQKETEISSLKADIQKLTKLRDAANKKLRTVEEQKLNLEHLRETLKLQISAIEKELELNKRASEHERKEREDLLRERDSLSQSVHKAASNTKIQSDMVKVLEQTKINFEQEIVSYREEAAKLRKAVARLEKERDKVIGDSSAASAQILQCMDDLKVKEAELYDMKKKVCAMDIKYKQQEQLFEAARSDRNSYSRSLVEKQDEIVELKKKLKTVNHQVEHLKDEISSKNEALEREHSDFMKIEREREKLKAEIDGLKKEVSQKETSLAALKDREIKLLADLANAEAEKNHEKKKLDAIVRDKNLIGTQLVQRNDELSLLYEKIELQERTLNRGEVHYAQRLEDIRVLKLEIKKLRMEKELLQKRVVNMNEMSNEVYKLEKDLLREKTKCRSMEDELENPINVHRWRRLEASDPSTYEMIEKIQMLQKRLIKKTEEAVEKEMLIQEREKMFEEMKKVLARQFNPEVKEQVHTLQITLKEKNRQLKAITSEMVMNQQMNKEYKVEIENLKEKMKDIKKKYIVMKKREVMRDEDKFSLPPLIFHQPYEKKNNNLDVMVYQENVAM